MRSPDNFPTTTHPALLILILSLAPTIGLGIGRFAYALVLPDMRESLHWSYSAAGFMNTINAAGYLVGALLASRMIRRFGWSATIRGGALAALAIEHVDPDMAYWTTSGGFVFVAILAGAGSVAAAFIGSFFAGSLLIETIFSLDGLGLLSFESVLNRDYPVVFANLYIFALVGLVVNLISDLTYTWIDPRIDFETREV